MKITKIEICNVKSFKNNTVIDFSESLNILIGPNGGGKSNLLDIITIILRKFFLRTYAISETRDSNGVRIKSIQFSNIFTPSEQFLEKFIGEDKESFIRIFFRITKGDLTNIKTIRAKKKEFEEKLRSFNNRQIPNFDFLNKLDLRKLKAGKEISYEIVNNVLQDPSSNSAEEHYLNFLNHFELFIILVKELENININPIYLYFPPNRGVDQSSIDTTLSNENYHDLLFNAFNLNSHNQSSILKIATNYFAAKRRKYEVDRNQGYGKKWDKDEEVKLVTKYLHLLKYSWDLENTDTNRNTYQIVLKREGKSFNLAQASSGEKEIINFLFGIFAFNIKFGSIIIDEPEVHLHPKWQLLLTDIFLELSKKGETDNQFILSTHSPVFIKKETISQTIRIYKNAESSSEAVCINKKELGSTKELLHIINTHNNQKIFFADKVVLVEGVHDRIIYESLLQKYVEEKSIPEIIEVVEVHGKGNFLSYRDFLESFKIQNFIIADQDYLRQVGDSKVKNLFRSNNSKIEKILKDPKSKDRKSLVELLEESINSSNLEELKKLWKDIKDRNTKIKENLTSSERQVLETNIANLQSHDRILILSKGEIEDYLPNSFKELNKTIDLIQDKKKFNPFVKSINKTDLKDKLLFILDN